MRMRKKKHTSARMAQCAAFLVQSPGQYKGKWNEPFGNANPIHLEIGCGKGGFITTLAQITPDVNFVALERERDCLVLALEKTAALALPNLLFIAGDAALLGEYFAPGECERIYLNFSDPWPKSRHAKRRLTYRSFLEIYQQILCENGEIILKTDNLPLFEFSLSELRYCGFVVSDISYNLQNTELQDNVITEYEAHFREQGLSICRCRARMPEPEPE